MSCRVFGPPYLTYPCPIPPFVSPPRSEELRKEARQLKKELQAIKQRKEDASKPAAENDQEGKRKRLLFRRAAWRRPRLCRRSWCILGAAAEQIRRYAALP